MAIRQEDLLLEATVYQFPGQMMQARVARRRMIHRRRMTLGIVSVVMAASLLASLPTL